MEDSEELDLYVSSPVYKVHYYDSLTSGKSGSYASCIIKLEEIKRLVYLSSSIMIYLL